MGHDHIHLPLHDNRQVFAFDGTLGFIQTENDPAFIVKFSLRTINIFAAGFFVFLFTWINAGGESDDIIINVGKRKHDAVAKTVVVAARAFFTHRQASGEDLLVVEFQAFIFRQLLEAQNKVVPAVGGIANAPVFDGFFFESAF